MFDSIKKENFSDLQSCKNIMMNPWELFTSSHWLSAFCHTSFMFFPLNWLSKLQTSWHFTPKYFRCIAKEQDVFLCNPYSMFRDFNIDTLLSNMQADMQFKFQFCHLKLFGIQELIWDHALLLVGTSLISLAFFWYSWNVYFWSLSQVHFAEFPSVWAFLIVSPWLDSD